MELFNNGRHVCLAFRDLVRGGDAVQANQFLIFDNKHAALIDPGGDMIYSQLYMAISDYMNVKNLDYVLASHQDPDIVASLDKWLLGTGAKIVVPALWERFIPHFTRTGKWRDRVMTMPDQGMRLQLGSIELLALPAHFMHAEGNFQFYDPVSKILFSGDLGANLGDARNLNAAASRLDELLPYMDGFHKRYINSNRVCRFWANMARQLDIDLIAPQHGRALTGRAIPEFIEYIENLECGVDLMHQAHYQIPA